MKNTKTFGWILTILGSLGLLAGIYLLVVGDKIGIFSSISSASLVFFGVRYLRQPAQVDE